MTLQRYIALEKRPAGRLTEDLFSMRSRQLLPLPDGHILVRIMMLSIDPYLRGAISATPMVGAAVPLGNPVPGRGLGEVLGSRSSGIEPGQLVVGDFGWQDYAVSGATTVRAVPRLVHPPSWHLGVLGVPGITALLSLELIGEPKAGETVFVSSAAGGVGSAAGQITKALGCRTIGSAGSDKMRVCKEAFGFDHFVDRSAPAGLAAQLAEIEGGIDVALDNVGDEVLSAIVPRMRPGGRVILCGRIAHYDDAGAVGENGHAFETVLFRQLRIQGFNVRAHAHRFDGALEKLRSLADRGELVQIESICRGLELAPAALCGLFDGRYTGKVLVEP